MLRMLALIIVSLLILPASAASFPDTGDSPFESEIESLKESGAVSGYGDGTFRPDRQINRAEFVKMILLEDGHGIDDPQPGQCFTDFHKGAPEWYYAYACFAKQLGYVQGYPDGSFGGGRTIVLAEALKIVMMGRNIPLPQYFQKPDTWYDPYFIAGDELSLFPTLPRNPSHLVTREEMAYLLTHVVRYREPKPEGTSASRFLLNEIGYACSREIQGEWREAEIGPRRSLGWYFHPADQEEFEMFCREDFIIEYRAVLDILRRDDVARAIEKYDTVHAWVRALSHRYIGDKDYLTRILPDYDGMTIDCIIVVHTPEGTRFFIENGDTHESHDDHRYIEVPAADFLSSLNAASDEDVTAFWLGLH